MNTTFQERGKRIQDKALETYETVYDLVQSYTHSNHQVPEVQQFIEKLDKIITEVESKNG